MTFCWSLLNGWTFRMKTRSSAHVFATLKGKRVVVFGIFRSNCHCDHCFVCSAGCRFIHSSFRANRQSWSLWDLRCPVSAFGIGCRQHGWKSCGQLYRNFEYSVVMRWLPDGVVLTISCHVFWILILQWVFTNEIFCFIFVTFDMCTDLKIVSLFKMKTVVRTQDGSTTTIHCVWKCPPLSYFE